MGNLKICSDGTDVEKKESKLKNCTLNIQDKCTRACKIVSESKGLVSHRTM